ncbi:MAG: hypothetical protein ACKOWF_16570 [Chloroflexota bacterium]
MIVPRGETIDDAVVADAAASDLSGSRICFMKVPKTASSSIVAMIRSVHQSAPEQELRESGIRSGRSASKFAAALFAHGHVSWHDVEPLLAEEPREWVPIMAFRDPLARTLSHYRYLQRRHSSPGITGRIRMMCDEAVRRPLRDLARDETSLFHGWTMPVQTLFLGSELQGPITEHPWPAAALSPAVQHEALKRALERLHRLAWIGVVESLERDLQVLAHDRGWAPVPLRWLNRSVASTAGDGSDRLDGDTLRLLMDRLSADYLLIESAREIAAERWRRVEATGLVKE